MKLTVAVCTLMLAFANIGHGQFSIIHNFDESVQSPLSSGIDNGRVYGITEVYFTSDQPITGLFTFDLDGNDFRYRDVNPDINAFGPRERFAGPLAFDQGTIYGNDDLGRPFTASTTDLVASTVPMTNSNNWVNPIIVNDSFVVGGDTGVEYGIATTPLSGGVSTTSFFAISPVTAVATDGSNVFTANIAAPSAGILSELVSISDTGSVTALRVSTESTFSLAYHEGQVYGFGDEGLYRINLDGSGFEVLKSDISGLRITISDDTIYGLTASTFNSSSQPEQLFQIGTDGSDFTVLHEFGPGTENGSRVNSDLVVVGSTLYGSTNDGGANDLGTYYSYDLNGTSDPNAVPEPNSLAIWLLLACCGIAAKRRKRIA